MRITRIEIQNFRSIRHLVVDLGETTVFVGPNNAGKTAILDALRIALTRRWGQRGTGFTEYDVHLADDADDPKTSDGVSIELRTEESVPGEWPDAVAEDLDQIVQLDLNTGRRAVVLRTRCAWNEDSGAFEPSWEFLNVKREPLAGRGARRINLERFWRYLPVFYLGALRDAGDEFSPRSQFWGRLLKALEIPLVLALEEPETHLHPQAARTLWTHVAGLSGQKIVTTHSPYFVQHVPFRDLRLVRLTANGTEVRSLPASFSAALPAFDGLDAVVNGSAGRLDYNEVSETLTVKGRFEDGDHRALLARCGTHDRRNEVTHALRDLRERSSLYVSDQELEGLEIFARRMRGEVFFAERWMIVEGQADYLLINALALALDYDLDQHGVAVIDAQNNGNPVTFAVLARALAIPWLAVFDGDDQGRQFVRNIGRRGFSADDVATRCRIHPEGDLETQLVADGLGSVLRGVLTELDVKNVHALTDEELPRTLRNNKTSYAAVLGRRLRADPNLAQRGPAAFRAAIADLRGLA